MALGAVTKVSGGDYVIGNKKVRTRDVVLSTGANWTAAGESLTPAMVNLRRVISATCELADNGTLSFQVDYDIANKLLIAYGQNATPGAAVGQPKVTGGTDLSAFSVRITFVGD